MPRMPMIPGRFGKSLWCRILECYYNINQKDDFERLFGQTYIGKHPTPLQNSFFVLYLDFSVLNTIQDHDLPPQTTIEEFQLQAELENCHENTIHNISIERSALYD